MTIGDVVSQYPSSIITVAIAFAFLWLALYIFRVNPDDAASKLASAAMFVVFLYLLSDFTGDTASTKEYLVFYQRALWWLPFAPVLWLHIAQSTTQPLAFRGAACFVSSALNLLRSNSVLGALYGFAALFVLVNIFTDSIFNFGALQTAALPLKDAPLPTGPAYDLFAVFAFLIASAAWVNFLSQWWRQAKSGNGQEHFLWDGVRALAHTGIPLSKSRDRTDFWWLALGSILFWLASAGALVDAGVGIAAPVSLGHIAMGLGVAIVAIAILRHNAFLKVEALERDVLYASIGALAIALAYIAAIFIGQLGNGDARAIPVLTLVLITALALTTHMLADMLKIWFSDTIGTRLGIFTAGDVDKMRRLYEESAKVKRSQRPAVEIFDDGDKTVGRLLELLTPRQREIITLRAKGLSDKQIADMLEIKLPTVRKHIEDIKTRIGSRDKADCAVYCVVTGLLTKEDLIDWFDSLELDNNHA